MFDDRNPFGTHPVNHAYQQFKEHIDTAVMNGKMDHTTAIQHITALHNFASEKQHDKAAQYIKEHSEKLGIKHKEAWFKEENWGK